jgi:hypothetical protein
MRQAIEHWKEGVGVFLYFLFLAIFTPKAREMGWGMQGMMFVVVAGAVLIGLVYLLLKGIGDYIESHREEVSSFKEYMGIGSSTPHVELAMIGGEHTNAELDAMLATNPYASAELFDDHRYTRLLPSVEVGDDEETRLVDEPEDDLLAPGGKVTAIYGENPRRRLDLAENFQPDANDPLATGVFFVGIPGSGKTVALALFLEQYILRYGLAAVIFCLEGDLRTIVQGGLCPRGIIAGPTTMPSMAYVVRNRVQVVVDLQQCRKPGEAFINYELAAQLIAKTVKELINAQAAIDSDDRLPCLLALDETQIWTPQNPPSYLDGKTAKDLLDTITIVATRGRKYGVVPFLAAQRIPKVHKDVIAGCETRILGKADLDNDIARYREYVSREVISDQGIRSLGQGRMVVCMNGKRLIVQFNNRASKHKSHTPHLTGALNNPVSRIPADILAASAAASRPVEAVQPTPITSYAPRHESTQVESLHPANEPITSGSMEKATRQPLQFPRSDRRGHMSGLADELRAALSVYQPGMTYRDLGRALGCSDTEARILWQELKQRGLLHIPGETEQEAAKPEIPAVPPKSSNKADLERALQAYDQGNKTIDALAVALSMTPWTVRTLYAQVIKLRKNAG